MMVQKRTTMATSLTKEVPKEVLPRCQRLP